MNPVSYTHLQHITQVTAQLCTLDKKKADDSFIEVDDNAFCIYKLENGITGTMAALSLIHIFLQKAIHRAVLKAELLCHENIFYPCFHLYLFSVRLLPASLL